MGHREIRDRADVIGSAIITEAIHIHKSLGPGLLEHAYEVALAYRLRRAGLQVSCQPQVPLVFEDCRVDDAFRADLIVEGLVLIELKSTDHHHPVFTKQVLTYLRLTNLQLGYLLNFGFPTMKEGIKRLICPPRPPCLREKPSPQN